VTARSGHIFVSSPTDSKIYDLNPFTGAVIDFATGLSGLDGMAFSPDGSILYFVDVWRASCAGIPFLHRPRLIGFYVSDDIGWDRWTCDRSGFSYGLSLRKRQRRNVLGDRASRWTGPPAFHDGHRHRRQSWGLHRNRSNCLLPWSKRVSIALVYADQFAGEIMPAKRRLFRTTYVGYRTATVLRNLHEYELQWREPQGVEAAGRYWIPESGHLTCWPSDQLWNGRRSRVRSV